MNSTARLGLFGAGLAVLFVGALVAGAALVPDSTVAAWTEEAAARETAHERAGGHEADADGSAAHGGHAVAVRGLGTAQDGYLLTDLHAPGKPGQAGELSFRILADGAPLTSYATSHDRDLHLIVVRSDGAGFRHVHPALAPDGTWSIPWTWRQAGSHRIFADFVPADKTADETDAANVTLSRTVDVAGRFDPAPPRRTSRTATVDGYAVRLTGDLATGATSTLTARVTRDGKPVTTLQPYLGAFGHLVALRQGDLGYLHVHPEGAEPGAGDTAGPEIAFATAAPTPGRYLLYLDFRVDGEVRTARFVLDAGVGAASDHGDDAAPHPDDDHTD